MQDHDPITPTETNIFFAVDAGNDERAKRLIHALTPYELNRLCETALYLLTYTEAEQRIRQ